MLATMRNTVSGIFAKALMLFLVITFAVWGIGDVVRGGAAPNTLVSVGDNDITVQEFGRALQEVQRNAGGKIPPELLNSDMFRQQVLQRMVEQRLSENAARDVGIAVGTDLIAKRTKENPMFQNVDGSFNASAFQAYLRETQQGEAAYRQQVSKETLRDLYMSSADLEKLTLPASYLALKSLAAEETRKAKLITISPAAANDVDEKDLRAFYEQYKEVSYLEPEKRTLQYAVISKASMDKAIAGDTSGAALEDLGFTVEDSVAAGESMDKALKSAKLDAQVKTLKLVDDGAGNTALEKAVIEQGFALNEGETSGLLSDTDSTYFMVSVDNVESARPKPFDAVKADVAARYRKEKGAEIAKEKISELKAALNGADSLEAQLKLAKDAGASVRESDALSRPDVRMNIGISDPLARGIFNASVGDVVGPVTSADGGYTLAILTDVVVPKEPKEQNAAAKLLLLNEMTGQTYKLWVENLIKRHPVRQIATLPNSAPQE